MVVLLKLLGGALVAWLVLMGCTTTTISDAEQDARMAECQLIDDDDERRRCLERLALGDPADPIPAGNPTN